MSFLRWFGKREATPETQPSSPSDLGVGDATLPMHHALAATPSDKGSRRSERMQRRELLYGVVRECMTATGVLSSTYKFKVLSLDSSGREYLIMMDVPGAYLADPTRLADMEGAIARSAKERFDMLVTAVYWRVNEAVTVHSSAQPVQPAMPRVPAAAKVESVPATATQTPTAEDALAQEVLAFKRAVAAAAQGSAPTQQAAAKRAAPRQPPVQPDFSDTEPFDPGSPLGPSQFGGLN